MEAFLHDLSWVPALRNDNLTLIFNAFTFLGYLPFFLIFLPMGYWLGDKPMFTRLAILVGLVALSNTFLKDLFQDPRPLIQYALDQRVGDSFGLPSGHAQIAAAMWFWLAIELRRAWAWALAMVVTLGVGASRIYLGVHDLEDVIGGTLLGLATVVIYRGFLSDSFSSLHKLNPIIYLIAIAALVPLFTYAWPREPAPGAILSLGVFMFAWLLGDNLQKSMVHHRRHANLLVASLSSVVAIAALFAAFIYGGKYFASIGQSQDTITVAQSALMSLYATLIAPSLFRLLGLSGEAK